MWVKICGIMNMKAAVAAQEAGADAVGFIFAPSRRQISADRAQSLIMGLPPEIAKVGVFVDEDLNNVRLIAEYAGLTHVQLHGDEPPEAIERLGLPVIKAFRIKNRADLQKLPAYRGAAGLLLEAHVPGQAGGTGQTMDWSLLQEAANVMTGAGIACSAHAEPLIPGKPKLILAGGLTPMNVDEAIQMAMPGGVDVSSGVELDGEKDLTKIYDFITMAKGAFL